MRLIFCSLVVPRSLKLSHWRHWKAQTKNLARWCMNWVSLDFHRMKEVHVDGAPQLSWTHSKRNTRQNTRQMDIFGFVRGKQSFRTWNADESIDSVRAGDAYSSTSFWFSVSNPILLFDIHQTSNHHVYALCAIGGDVYERQSKRHRARAHALP